MAFTEVDPTTILKEYPVPPQRGPLRQFDKEMRCMNGEKQRRCGSSTFLKVNGVPKCMTHALNDLNNIIVELTEGSDGDSDEN